MEWDMWVMVRALVTPEHGVIEFGARYGTTSCMLAAATSNSGRVVVVGPDAKAHSDLLHNRDAHSCNFHTVLGTVANHTQKHIGSGKLSNGYAFSTGSAINWHLDRHSLKWNEQHHLTIPNIRIDDLQRSLGWRVDALVADCEGCLEHVLFQGDPPLVSQLKLLIVEQDRAILKGTSVNYRSIFSRLVLEFGFTRVWWSGDTMDAFAGWSKSLTRVGASAAAV